MSPAETYALTHAIMYVTDFGAKSLLPASLDINQIATMIDAGLACNIMSENLDLLGELLISAAILGQPWSPYSRFAWCLLTRTWDDLGFLPCPSFDTSTYSSITGEEASSYAFLHTYHTSYVGGILCAILLCHPNHKDGTRVWTTSAHVDSKLLNQCERAVNLAIRFCQSQQEDFIRIQSIPEAEKTPDVMLASGSDQERRNSSKNTYEIDKSEDYNKSGIDAIIAHVLSYQRISGRSNPYWMKILPSVALNDDELAVVLVDALLIHSARNYDLAILASILVDVIRFNLPITATFLEATSFLTRQQLPCGALGAFFVIKASIDLREAIYITAYLAQSLNSIAEYLSTQLK